MTTQLPSWPQKMDQIQEAICWAAGANVIWDKTNEGGWVREANQPWIELRMRRIKRFGLADEVKNIDGGSGVRKELQLGQRGFCIDAKVYSKDADHNASSWYYAEKLHTNLWSSIVKDKWLDPVRVTLSDVGDIHTVDLPTTDESLSLEQKSDYGRAFEVAVVELKFTTDTLEHNTASNGYWIETVKITTDVLDAVGSLPAHLQLYQEEIGS